MRFFKIRVLFFFLIVCFLGFSQSSQKHKYKNLSPKDFYIFMSAYKNSVLIDVSTEKEYQELRIPNSCLASNSTQLFVITDTLDFDQAIFVYCEYGDRSKQACKLLIKKGFKNVINLKGGLIEWMKLGYKIDSTKPINQ